MSPAASEVRVGREYPSTPVLGVGAVVIRADKVLLIRRGREPLKGRWSLPGGALEIGETLAEGVAREVLEETGLRVRPVELVTTLDRIYRDEGGRVRFHYVLLDWLCVEEHEAQAEIRCGDDASAVIWAPLSGLEEYGLEPVTLQVIKRGAELAGENRR